MNEGFAKLKDIGAQKIHETTHIARLHVQALLDENFENLNSIQFLGFISILEREYGIDLSELKNNGVAYFDENTVEVKEEKKVKVFVPHKKKGTLTFFYIAIVAMIFIAFSYLNIFSPNCEVPDVIKVDNSAIESATSNLSIEAVSIKTDDINNSTELNQADKVTKQVNLDSPTESNQDNKVEKASDELVSFKIVPTNEVWLGYIDLATYKKDQKIFSDEFSLDPSKDWILAFGHGHISIEVNGIIKKFKNPKNVRFSYISGELKELSLEEFKGLNKGSRW
ncbi:MAG: hypothetical protein KAR81_02440 [Sulfurimonas sp.]|nr:hypothetical protein [Sulfurimonas sp.]